MSNFKHRPENLVMNDVEGKYMLFKNFSGEKSDFNLDGKRSFSIILDEDYARELEEQGWNIKWPKVQDEENPRKPRLEVFIRFDVIPPKIWMINSGSKIKLDEESIAELDYSYIERFDIVISPYMWEVNGKSGIKAYVKSMAAIMEEDPIDMKYKDIPDRSRRDDREEAPF